MEFVKTPSFYCPHVDRAACTNFSTRIVELQPSEGQEILPFLSLSFLLSPFMLTLPFPSLSFFSVFISYELFFLISLFFFLIFFFLLFFPFCFYPTNSFIFLSLFLFLIFSSFILGFFSSLWMAIDRMG